MKLYLSAGILEKLIVSPNKKKIGNELESILHEGHRYFTSVYTLLTLLDRMRLGDSDKWRMILHLISELVEEILPIDKNLLEIVGDGKEINSLTIELAIARLSGNDEVLIYEEDDKPSQTYLPLRNLFRKADR